MTSPSKASARRTRRPAAARHLAPVPTPTCEHLHDTTSRYDHAKKVLTFVLVCHACKTEKVILRVPYEPRFEQIDEQSVRLAA